MKSLGARLPLPWYVERTRTVNFPPLTMAPVARRPKLPCRLAFEHSCLSCPPAPLTKSSKLAHTIGTTEIRFILHPHLLAIARQVATYRIVPFAPSAWTRPPQASSQR